jgi:hypothetical protein
VPALYRLKGSGEAAPPVIAGGVSPSRPLWPPFAHRGDYRVAAVLDWVGAGVSEPHEDGPDLSSGFAHRRTSRTRSTPVQSRRTLATTLGILLPTMFRRRGRLPSRVQSTSGRARDRSPEGS